MIGSRLRLYSGMIPVLVTVSAGTCKGGESQPAPVAERVTATAPAEPARPTTRPTSEIVLVRIGDRDVVTQAQFDRWAQYVPAERFSSMKGHIVRTLVQNRLFLLYLAEHPDLVPEKDLEDEIERTMEIGKVNTLEEFKKRLKEQDTTWEEFRQTKLIRLGRLALTKEGIKKGRDEEYLKKLYEENPTHFNGTRMRAKHILIGTELYDTPAEREAKRRRLAAIREDIISGKRTWSECVRESNCNSRFKDGSLGFFTRHLMVLEPVAEAAWSLDPWKRELSKIVESPLGFHLIQVNRRRPAARKLEDEDTKRDMRAWLQRAPFLEAIREMQKKYPVVGVEAPVRPTRLATRPAHLASRRRLPATRPASRPASGAGL